SKPYATLSKDKTRRGSMIVLRELRISASKKLPVLAGLAVAVLATPGLIALHPQAPRPHVGPSPNDNMTNGFMTAPKFISQLQHRDADHHTDLAAIYGLFNFTSGDYTKFSSSAVQGVDFKNGDIKVGDVTVATGASSFGRTEGCQGSNPTSLTTGLTTI